MLTGTGLGDDAGFAHLALHQQRLAQGIVDLVRPGMSQILALKIDLRAAQMITQPLGIGNRGRATDKGALEVSQLFHKRFVIARLEVSFFQLIERAHQCFRHKLAAIGAKVTALIGVGTIVDSWICCCFSHEMSLDCSKQNCVLSPVIEHR